MFCFYLNLIKTLPAYKVSSEALWQGLASPVSNDGAVERCIEFPDGTCANLCFFIIAGDKNLALLRTGIKQRFHHTP